MSIVHTLEARMRRADPTGAARMTELYIFAAENCHGFFQVCRVSGADNVLRPSTGTCLACNHACMQNLVSGLDASGVMLAEVVTNE